MKEDKKQIQKNIQNRQSRKTGVYYSFLTIVLVFCLLQIGYGAILNISKIISYQGKTIVLHHLLKKAQMRNQDLKAEKKMITLDNSLEGIARNNLKMAGHDEILIIINKKIEPNKKNKNKFVLNFGNKQKNSTENGKIYIPQEVVEE